MYNKHGAILEAYIFLKLGFDAADHFLFNGAANDHPHRFQTEGIWFKVFTDSNERGQT